MERYEIEGELNGCKQILQNTDYFILKAIEEILGAESLNDLLKIIIEQSKEVHETVELRKQMRARINELEELLAEMDETEAAMVAEEAAE